MPSRKLSSPSKEIIAQYLITEFESLSQRAAQNRNDLTNKINFYMVFVTAVIGGLILISDNPMLQSFILPSTCLIMLFLHVLGWITMSQGVDLSAGAILQYRRIGRIRQWFLNYDPSILPYLPFDPGDNRPKYFARYAPTRGVEAILLLVNASLAGIFISLLWLLIDIKILILPFSYSWTTYGIALGMGILVTVIIWRSEIRYLENFMRKKDQFDFELGYVHFPAEQNKMGEKKL
jgi:hypothetical protein